MYTLPVTFTQEQYDRYKAALQKVQQSETPPTDEQLIAQLKREASAITYAAEIGNGTPGNWQF